MAPIPAQIPLLPNRGGWWFKGRLLSLSLSCCKHQPVLSLSIQTCIMTTFLPRQRHIRGAGRWKQRRPSFPAARRLPPHLSSLLSFDYIHAYACMSLPKIKSFSSTRLLLHRMRCVHNHCVCHLTPLLQPSNVLSWTFVLLSRTPNKPLSI